MLNTGLDSFFTQDVVPLIFAASNWLVSAGDIIHSVFSVNVLNVIAHCLKWSSTFICRALRLEDTHYTNMSMPISLPSIS